MIRPCLLLWRSFFLLNIEPIQPARVLSSIRPLPRRCIQYALLSTFTILLCSLVFLDGGNHILLANQKAAKSLICSHNHNLAHTFSSISLCNGQQIPALSLSDSNQAQHT